MAEGKRYFWTTLLVNGVKYALIKKDGEYVLADLHLNYQAAPLTELQVLDIGLKTSWFTKEEVK
ncbi:hypothetical protein [Leuconostoc lactis]|uniref:hypothetical protein n=1 Tax=Leuconostoc lactis TaxID=1246 RepID=UPI00289D93D2|nr:hypothetical protein [Leuconostoc lactis]